MTPNAAPSYLLAKRSAKLSLSMGRVRVAGLDFTADYLRSEIAAFQNLMQRDRWMAQETLDSRRAAVKGLTFVMLNLRCDADENESWNLFHEVMDAYYDLCDQHHITI